jgi:hypothetical protein
VVVVVVVGAIVIAVVDVDGGNVVGAVVVGWSLVSGAVFDVTHPLSDAQPDSRRNTSKGIQLRKPCSPYL